MCIFCNDKHKNDSNALLAGPAHFFPVSNGLLDAMGETKSSVENCKNIDSIVERVPDSLGINKR